MELPLDFTTLGIVASICIAGIVITGRLPKFSENSTKLMKTRIKERDELIEELRTDIKTYKARYFNLSNKIEREPEIDMQGDLSSVEGIKSILPSILPALGDYLPKWAQPFMKNPQIAGMLVDAFAKNPQLAMSLVGKFMGKGKGSTSESSESSQPNSQLELPPGTELF